MDVRRTPLKRAAAAASRRNVRRPGPSIGTDQRIYRSIFDNAGIGIARTDAQGRFVQFNRTWLAMTQYDERDLTGCSLEQITHPEDRDLSREHFAALVAGRTNRYRIEKRYIRKDGSICWVDLVASPLRDAAGHVESTIALCVDITEHVQARHALQRQQRLMSDLLATTKEGFWFVDKDARTVEVNPAMCAMLGRPREQIMGRPVFDFLDEANAAVFRAQMEARKRGTAGVYEIAFLRPDGSQAHCLNNGSAVFDENGRNIGSVGLCTDITPIKDAQRQLEQAKDEAQAANRAKSAFLATMSHEIRTPLNGVTSVIELLADGAASPEQRVQIQLARKAADQLLNIIGNVLDISKLEAGKVAIEAVPFHLDTVIDAAAETFTAEAARKDLNLLVDCDPVEYQLIGDPTRLKQIVLNLIGNAVKFTAKGRILVRADLSRSAEAARLVLSVSDSGIGISPTELPRLMEKFVQASTSTTREYGGSGLGLAICKQLAEAMGGRLTAASELGRGSTFTLEVTLPVSDQYGTTRPASLLRDIIVITADHGLRGVCSRLLTAEGHRHAIARNVDEALELLRLSAGKARTILFDEAAGNGQLQRDLDTLSASPFPVDQMVLLAGPTFERRLLAEPSRHAPDILGKPLTRSKLKDALSAKRASRHGPAPAPHEAGTSRPAAPAGQRLVLVAEDNLTNQYVLRKTLERLGWTVHVAGDGLEAVAMAGERAFDLVLMDLQMPRMDGIAAARRIRAGHGPNRETPIIAITANAFTDDVKRCLDAGMNGHLPKPLRRQVLADMMESMLERQRSTGTASTSDS